MVRHAPAGVRPPGRVRGGKSVRESDGAVAHAAARVDLAGGSLDLWPLGLLVDHACTVNVAISLAATAEASRTGKPGVLLSSEDLSQEYVWRADSPQGPLPLVERFCRVYRMTDGWRLSTRSDVPAGSGLGGSSAMSVALALVLERVTGGSRTMPQIVALCRDLEASNLRVPAGVQDFWPAIEGGVLCIHCEPGGERVEKLEIPLKKLASRMVVVYSGHSRVSAATNWALVRRFLDGDPETVGRLTGIAEVARRLREKLVEGDLDAAGPLLLEEWQLRRGLAEGISTPALEDLICCGLKAGALGAKACGAGGGGCLAFLVREGARLEVEGALERSGARVLPAHPVPKGHTVEVHP